MIKNAIALIFRTPEFGKVKKRLEKDLGPEKTLFYYKIMLHETIKKILTLNNVKLVGFYKGLLENLEMGFDLVEQKGDSLGEIIINAITEMSKRKFKKILVIGSDSPDLPLEFLTTAFDYLDKSEIVVGPSEDGGFYLLGCKGKLDPEIFQNIKWGENTVFKTLKDNIEKNRLCLSELPLWYDVDDKDTLERWLNLLDRS